MRGVGQGCGFHGCIKPSRIPVEPKEHTYADKYLNYLLILCQYICACDSSMIFEKSCESDMRIDSLLGA